MPPHPPSPPPPTPPPPYSPSPYLYQHPHPHQQRQATPHPPPESTLGASKSYSPIAIQTRSLLHAGNGDRRIEPHQPTLLQSPTKQDPHAVPSPESERAGLPASSSAMAAAMMHTPMPLMNSSFFPGDQQCVETTADFFDLNQMTASTQPPSPQGDNMVLDDIHLTDDFQRPAKPSHEYDQFKQQTGLPANSLDILQQPQQNGYAMTALSNTGLPLMDYDNSETKWEGDSSTDFLGGLNSSLGSGFAPSDFSTTNTPTPSYVNPAVITHQDPPRMYPGVHKEAALARAAAVEANRRRLLQQAALLKPRPQMTAHTRGDSNMTSDPATAQAIERVLATVKSGQGDGCALDGQTPVGLPQIVRMRKEADQMDEDEKLLQSEEGKKLTSKERRQLRNKVSARAFRSRRKEYITSLETDCTEKNAEILRLQKENQSYRKFIDYLLSRAEMKPLLDQLAERSAPTAAPPPATARMMSGALMTNPFVPVSNPQAQQLSPSNPQPRQNLSRNPSQQHDFHVGMARVPNVQFDPTAAIANPDGLFDINSNPNGFRCYAVTELPQGPASPLDVENLSPKGHNSFLSQVSPLEEAIEEAKADYPVIEAAPTVEKDDPIEQDAPAELEEDDDELYGSAPAASKPAGPIALPKDRVPAFVDAHCESSCRRSEPVSDEAAEQLLSERLDRICQFAEPVLKRIEGMTAYLEQ